MYNLNKIIVQPNSKISLDNYDSSYTGKLKKKKGKEVLKANVEELYELQKTFYADERFSLLIIFQASDAAGKDSTIKHVFSGVNPQGVSVHNFKSPSKKELAHDYLWRHYKQLPEKGMIEIFNRSHYENVLVTRVHPYYIAGTIPGIETVDKIDDNFWNSRFNQINNFEKHISENGTHIIKFFLNISPEEQKKRFLDRIDTPEKNWKFNSGDLKERKLWDKYKHAFEQMLSNTSTGHAPWHIIPADNKYFARYIVSQIIKEKLQSLNLKYPMGETKEQLETAKQQLLNE